jgi:PAS domain S-box-containing protein
MKASDSTASAGHSPKRLLAPLAGAAIVLAVGAAISFSASSILSHHLAREAQARFDARSGYMLASLERRLNDFSNLILGMQGLFIASAHVNREEFRRYSENLNLQQRLPGLQALSFQRRVVRQDKAAFLARVRNDRSLDPQGYPEFAIRPEGERAEYIVIDFIEPMQANLAAFGYDASTQPANADAIRLARDTGRVHVSEPFSIVQSPGGLPRIVLRAPVYRRGQPLTNVEQRRAALEGFVVLAVETHATFVEYFKDLLMDGERLVIEDAGPAQGSSVARRTPIADTDSNAGRPLLNKRFNLEFGGRNWELRHSADAAWVNSLPGQRHPDTVLASGLVIGFLLAALYLAMATARYRALRLAEERTRVLRATQDNMAQGISVVDRELRLIGHNRRFLELLGFPESLAGENATFADFVRYNAERGEYGPGDLEDLVRARIELARRFELHRLKRTRPDGTVLEIVGKPLPGGGMVTTYTDITAQERAQEALRQSEQRHRTLVEMSPDAVFAYRDGIIQLANPAAARLFGAASPEQLVGYDVRKLVAPEDLPRVRERIASLESGEAAFVPPNEVRYLTLDGNRVEVESIGALIELDGRPAILTVARDITERKRVAEQMLKERNFRQRLIESIPGVFYLFDRDGRFLLWNRNFETVVGYTAEEMAMAHPLDFFEGNDRALVAERIGAVFTGGNASVEAQFKSRNGGKRPYYFTGERIVLDDGRPGLIGVGFDISERQRAEEALARQTAILQATLEAMDQGISVVDADLRMTALNRKFCDLLEFPEAMAREGADFADFARHNALRGEYGPCDVEEKVREMVERARQFQPHHFKRTRPNGRIVEIHGKPMPGGGFVTTYTDVTEQEHAQENVRRERDFRQQLIESIPGIFYLFDPAGRLLLWNRNLETILGRDTEELARLRSIDMFDAEDRARVREATRQAQTAGSASVEASLVTKYGARIPYIVTGIRIEVDGQQTFIGLGLDISERKLAEQVIRDLNDTLEQRVRERTAALEASNRELESFSYSVSHDLRAPLRALHGFSHLLEEEYAHRLDSNGLDYLRRIRSASQRMGDLIDDLINLARVSRQELKPVAIDLSQLAGEVATTLAEQAPERAVVWNIAPGITASADPLLMRVALENLLGNAWKFTAKTPGAVIEFGARNIDGATAYFVHDNGAGFEMAYVDKLFKPFQRLHRPDEFAGTGIGLATVHRIVQRHGGRIWAESAPGRGAAFYFTLP